jgi:putative transposase
MGQPFPPWGTWRLCWRGNHLPQWLPTHSMIPAGPERYHAMTSNPPHRKLIRHFHEPGDVHELTFSCYQRMPILTNNSWRAKLSECINEACDELRCHLAAFVYMPEHVHLLVWGMEAREQVSAFLSRVKQPLSIFVRADLEAVQSQLLARLMARERPGKIVFRFWQEGPGFDRNLFTTKAVQASIDYIHVNPVKRGLCATARDWRWSSARFYETDGLERDPLLPRITPLPAEFWLSA